MASLADQNVDYAMQAVKAGGDILSFSVVVATLMSWLPALAAAFTIVWTGLRIYQTWLEIRDRRRLRRKE